MHDVRGGEGFVQLHDEITLIKFLSYLRHAEKLIQAADSGRQTSRER